VVWRGWHYENADGRLEPAGDFGKQLLKIALMRLAVDANLDAALVVTFRNTVSVSISGVLRSMGKPGILAHAGCKMPGELSRILFKSRRDAAE
jgi:hypothetical protein